MKKIKIGILAFFLSLTSAFAQDAALLPNAVQQFFDANGNSLSSGKVYFYKVGTLTSKDTYTSSAATVINQNPITLNAGGKAPTGGIYGIGLYRQIVKDRNGNLIWDAVTAPGGGSGGASAVGDGNLVGTVLSWSGLIAPNQYLFAYGQEVTRASFPEFYTAITQQLNVICTGGSNTLTGITDTTQVNIGAPVELALCVVPGTTVVSKTNATVTLNNPSSVSINAVATFFPYGNGDGSTTFNIPDLRGRILAGRDNMGGTSAARLSSPTFGTSTPDALGAAGGSQTQIIQFPQVLVNPGTTLSANSLGSVNANVVQPTITLNYIIKVTPDTSISIATGVYAINGMTGTISCGSGLLCTGNIVSVITPSTTALTLVGTGWGLTGGPCTITCSISIPTTNPPFQYGNPINVGITSSVSGNILTLAVKGNDGNNPTASNPVVIPFRNSTVSNGLPTWLALTSSLSLDIPVGATLGTANTIPFRYWLAFTNDSNTIRLCVINTLSGSNIYPVQQTGIISASGIPANQSQTWYCGTSVNNKAYTTLGYLTYESGLLNAGQYASIPTVLQLYGPGVSLPGTPIQTVNNQTGILATNINTISLDNTIPQFNEGNEFISQNILTLSATNILDIEYGFVGTNSAASSQVVSLCWTISANCLTAKGMQVPTPGRLLTIDGKFSVQTNIISNLTLYLRSGGDSAGTTTFNGAASAQLLGGAMNSYLKIQERQR